MIDLDQRIAMSRELAETLLLTISNNATSAIRSKDIVHLAQSVIFLTSNIVDESINDEDMEKIRPNLYGQIDENHVTFVAYEKGITKAKRNIVRIPKEFLYTFAMEMAVEDVAERDNGE